MVGILMGHLEFSLQGSVGDALRMRTRKRKEGRREDKEGGRNRRKEADPT